MCAYLLDRVPPEREDRWVLDFFAVRRFDAAFLAGAFFAADFLAGAFFAADFLAGAFFAVELRPPERFAAGVFFAAAFFAGAFFAGAFLDADLLVEADFLTPPLLDEELEEDLLAVAFLAGAFRDWV